MKEKDETPTADRPWMNTALSPDERARLLESQMTLDERIGLLHVPMAFTYDAEGIDACAIGAAGCVPAIERLGVPPLHMSDASLGVTNPLGVRPGDGGTALPSGLALAATFNAALAYEGGAMIGAEAHAKGFNVLLAGGANLARDPRNGRNFEYLGEDPLLAGTLAGESIRGIQSQGVVSTTKHFSLNGQETNRHWADSKIDEAAHRESDLLAFQLAIERGHPGSVMGAYNLVNGRYACGNEHLLDEVLKGDWAYPGWVMSDWGATHSVGYAVRGLDQQCGEQFDAHVHFGAPLKEAVEAGEVPAERVSDMVRRILRSMFAVGLFDRAAAPAAIDEVAHSQVALAVAHEGIVLLENRDALLPLAKTIARIAVIGGHADAGVLSGGGSSQVISPGGTSVSIPLGGEGMMAQHRRMVFHPSSPLWAIRAQAKDAEVRFDDGRYVASASLLARWADVVVVFANQWMGEGEDAPDLSLPDGQDALIEAVATANAKTIVVLQTGGPVSMPWLAKAGAVLSAWYSGARGGEAIADILFGNVCPSGRLPVTFPASLDQYPRREIPGWGLPQRTRFEVPYTEGADVGYRRFAVTGERPLFPFGFGLSYTSFRYSALQVSGGETLSLSFAVTNTGSRPGKDAPQVYLVRAGGERLMRLIGFAKVALEPGETKTVNLTADARLLANFDAAARCWKVTAGDCEVVVAASATQHVLAGTARLEGRSIHP